MTFGYVAARHIADSAGGTTDRTTTSTESPGSSRR
jgi:hypothetical protein